MTQTGPDQHKVHIRCSDGFSRERGIGLWVATDRVVLVAPPAEAALLTPDEARRLRDQLDALAAVAESASAAREAARP